MFFAACLFSLQGLGAQMIPPATISSTVHEGLESLQQIRSLMPEKIWEQDFAILIDRQAFENSLEKLERHPISEKCFEPYCIPFSANRYFLRATLSGEPVRINDFYQEFEYSPFWRSPSMLERLDRLENQEMTR
jgi:hypothetical protein